MKSEQNKRTRPRAAGMLTVLGIVLTMVAASAGAQTTTGTITGSVKDTQGGIIPGAVVNLTSESRGTKVPAVVTNGTGDFVFVNLAPDTYSLTVTMNGFKPLKRTDIAVSPGDRVPLPTLVIEVGGQTETVTVTADSAVIQAQSGERSFTASTTEVANLPLTGRSFIQLGNLAPGVVIGGGAGSVNNRVERAGGGGSTNYMMDGVSTMDTGSNSPLLQMSVESIAEVKVVVSNYQAEYGRSSGVQIAAVTKSGTNRFHGSLYDVERNSDWNANSKTNVLNGDPKAISKQRDLGYSLGGPVGKPGSSNKLFFFYSQEFAPRTGGGDTQRFRFPTLAERAGDFSASRDSNGALYNLIKDPTNSAACTANNTTGCFADGGSVGKIPQNRLYQTGLNILKMFPEPNLPDQAGRAYNYEIIRPQEKLMSWQPAVRVDYQPTAGLRATAKYSGWAQPKKTILGTLPGWNDTQVVKPLVYTVAFTANYTLNSTTFLEGTFGRAANELTGCAFAQGDTGPTFCRSAFSMNPIANRNNAGLSDLPFLFPNAQTIDPRYYAFEALNAVNPTYWDGTQLLLPPNFAWGNRVTNAPPNVQFPGFLNVNRTNEVSISMTKLVGRHTLKGGFYNSRSYKAQQRGGWNGTINFNNDANNPLDTTFGFSNAAIGVFQSYSQVDSYFESSTVFNNAEFYLQDNWKVNNKLTLDYGVRFVRQPPAFDQFTTGSSFQLDQWNAAAAPVLYVPFCTNGATTCSGAARVGRNPQTGAVVPSVAIGTIVPGTGNVINGIDTAHPRNYSSGFPTLGVAPRFGMAYDLTGSQRIVLRGGGGVFFDRPSATNCGICVNPPNSVNAQRNYATLTDLTAGLNIVSLSSANQYSNLGLPTTFQWNAETQMALPWASSASIAYAGTRSYNQTENIAINNADYGAAYLAQNQDTTLAASATPGATSLPDDLLRPLRGYAGITVATDRQHRTFHSLQFSLQRRFQKGMSFGFSDTWSLSDKRNTAARIGHNADGTYFILPDQAKADALLGNLIDRIHVAKANFVWDMPDMSRNSGGVKGVLAILANDWQLSGIWSAQTGAPYTVGFSYSGGIGNKNLTGSPGNAARIRILGDPGSGCSSDPLRQFNAAAFAGPLDGSVGLESGASYLRGCFESQLDLSISRAIRVGGGKSVQLRIDVYNAVNQAGIRSRNTTMNIASLATSTVATNLPYDDAGNPIDTRVKPKDAGFGAANGTGAYQNPRTIQLQARFSF